MDVSGARLKVDRARRHLVDLQLQVATWRVAAPAPTFTVEALDDGHAHVVRVVEVPDVPVEWSLVLGDVVHNLRSALDLLAWQAVIAGGGSPSKRTAFPVFSRNVNDVGDKGVTVALKGAAPRLVESIRRFQPFNRCETREALRNDALWVLHNLDIEDKHHLLVVCAAVLRGITHNLPPEAVGCTVTVTLQPASDGAEVLRFSNLPEPLPSMDLDPSGQFDVWVGETDETAYVSISDLDLLMTQVAEVIDAFEKLSGAAADAGPPPDQS